MTSREVVCCACNHRFHEFFVTWDPSKARSKDGKIVYVEVAQCPKCRKFLYVLENALVGLDSDEYELLEIKLK